MQKLQSITSIKKSISDIRNYKVNILKNSLKVILISDPDTDKSCASLSVNIGALLDPKPYSGLAHFLEHMLFLGTEKYPKEDEFKTFLSQNSGSTNASTGLERTNYYFESSNDGFLNGLDR